MGGGLLLHWDQTVGAGASIGPAHHRLNQRETAMRSCDDDNYDDSVSKMKAAEEALEAKQKKQSSFELSGKLAAETNRVIGITLLFTKLPYAKKPDIRWRLYVFKGGEALNGHFCDFLFVWQVEKEQPEGMLKNQVRPYIMDLGSTNKTFINDNPIEPQRYYELFEKDTIKFGNSWSLIPINPGHFSPIREYVQLHENSA